MLTRIVKYRFTRAVVMKRKLCFKNTRKTSFNHSSCVVLVSFCYHTFGVWEAVRMSDRLVFSSFLCWLVDQFIIFCLTLFQVFSASQVFRLLSSYDEKKKIVNVFSEGKKISFWITIFERALYMIHMYVVHTSVGYPSVSLLLYLC